LITPAITSLAILQVNWNQQKDYVENFVPFLADCIRELDHEPVTLGDVQRQLERQFQLRLPQHAVKAILVRVQKRGYLNLNHGAYYRNESKLAQLNFHTAQQTVVRMHETLVDGLRRFCRESYQLELTAEDAETALDDYLNENQVDLLRATAGQSLIPLRAPRVKNARYLVAAYADHLSQTHAADFESLTTVVQGNMLANALFLPDPSAARQKFRRTTLYFDTPFLMSALGYDGQAKQEPCVELLDLLYETGADLCCFQHTVNEMRGALLSSANLIRRGNLHDAYGPSLEHFIQTGYSPAEIELFAAGLERNLDAHRIKVGDRPQRIHEYQIDEAELEQVLRERISYRSQDPVACDVDSIAAIMQLRRGQQYGSIETCKALFVTTNRALARAVNSWFYGTAPPEAVPPVISDTTLTTVLWLKRPLAAPNLPRKRIIADAFAAMQPDQSLMRRYLQAIDRIQTDPKVRAADDYFLLRYSSFARSALMELTQGDDAAFTDATVAEVLESVRRRIEGELREDRDAEAVRRQQAEQRAVDVATREADRLTRRAQRATRLARPCTWLVRILAVALLGVGLLSTFPWGLPDWEAGRFRYVLTALQVALFVLTISSLVSGTVLENHFRRLEVWLGRAFEKAFQLASGD